MSENTDFVLAGDSASSKLGKARELGAPVQNEAQFRKLLGEELPPGSSATQGSLL